MAVLIKIRRDTQANWNAYNPVLAIGEPAYVTDAHEFAVGDGSTPFAALPKFKTLDSLDLSAYALQAGVRGGFDVLQGQITTHQATIDAISAQQLADSAHLVSIDNQLSQFNGDYSGLDARLTNGEAEIVNLQLGVVALQDKTNGQDMTITNLTLQQGFMAEQIIALQGATLGEIDGGGAAG